MNTEEILKRNPETWTAEERAYMATIAMQAMAVPSVKGKVVYARETRSYYNEKNALELKAIIDEMMFDKIEREFPYLEFQENNGWSKQTLFLYVQQAIDWLADNFEDGQGTYRSFKQSVKLTQRKNDTGVRILWKEHKKEDVKYGRFAAVKKVVEQDQLQEWREPLFDWLSNPENTDKAIGFTKLSLRQEDILFIKNLIETPENNGRFFILRLEPNEFKIGRVVAQ